MRIYWRCCEQEESLSWVKRWENQPKLLILKKCWLSLQESISPEDTIVIFEDQCSLDTQEFLLKTCKTPNVSFIHITKHEKYIPTHFIEFAEYLDKWTKEYPEQLHYLLNDDYLLLPDAINILKSVFRDGHTGFALLEDYIDRYYLDRNKQCEVLLGSRSHWRSVPSTTGVICGPGSEWQKYMRQIKYCAAQNSDEFTWELCARTLTLCPLPGQASHLADGKMTPMVNWVKRWNEINVN